MNDKKPRGAHVCAVWGCKNTRMNSSLSFFQFPKDIQRAKTWAIGCGRKDLLKIARTLYKSYRVCTAHFEKEMFLNEIGNRLLPHATPKIFLKPKSTPEDFELSYGNSSSSAPSANLPPDGNKRAQKKYAAVIKFIPAKVIKLPNIKQNERASNVLSEPELPIRSVIPSKNMKSPEIEQEVSTTSPVFISVPKSEPGSPIRSTSPLIIPPKIAKLPEIKEEVNTIFLPEPKFEPELPIQSTSTSIIPPNVDDLLEIKQEESTSAVIPVSKLPIRPASIQYTIEYPKPLTASSSIMDKLQHRIQQLQNENFSLRHRIISLQRRVTNNPTEITLEQYKMLTKKFCESEELADFVNVRVSSSYLEKFTVGRRK